MKVSAAGLCVREASRTIPHSLAKPWLRLSARGRWGHSLDAAAEGRLSQMRTLGSATEVQFLGKKQHVLQMANVHDADNA